MRIMFLNKAPKAVYDVTEIERQLNSYASPGTKVEVCFPITSKVPELRKRWAVR